MQFAIIAPVEFTDISAQGDFELVLAQHLDDPVYVEKLKGRRIFLDNGAHEGAYKGVDWLLERIELIKPELVFAPDSISSGYESAKLTLEFLNAVEAKYGADIPFKIAAVPHGDTFDEYRLQFHKFTKDPRIDWLSISYLDPAKFYPKLSISKARRALLNVLATSADLKPCHLLGLGDGFEDIRYARTLPWVKSCDSSSPFMYGYKGQRYDSMTIPRGKVQTLDPTITELTTNQRENITHNIDFLKNKTKW